MAGPIARDRRRSDAISQADLAGGGCVVPPGEGRSVEVPRGLRSED